MLRLRNVAEETGERLKSLAALNRLVEFPLLSAQDGPRRLLIAGKPGADALAALNMLGDGRDESVCVLSAAQTMRALDHSEFDCAVFLAEDGKDPLAALARALRRHPRHAPMAVFQIADDAPGLSKLAGRGAREFLLRDQLNEELKPRAQLAMRRARLLRVMRTFLETCRGDGVCDPLSGAFTSMFLSEHGARLCARADQTDRPLTLLLIRLEAAAPAAPPGSKALRQASDLLKRVTRAEDFLARIGANKFLLLTPATRADDAASIAARIRGVVNSNSFSADDDRLRFAMEARTSFAERERGASIEESVAALLRRAPAREKVRQPLRQSPR